MYSVACCGGRRDESAVGITTLLFRFPLLMFLYFKNYLIDPDLRNI
jgi:hypothetical protein